MKFIYIALYLAGLLCLLFGKKDLFTITIGITILLTGAGFHYNDNCCERVRRRLHEAGIPNYPQTQKRGKLTRSSDVV